MSSEEKSWINWDDSPKWIGTALAISILLLRSLITYLVDSWQAKRNPQPPQPGTASPDEVQNPAPVLLRRSCSCIWCEANKSRNIYLHIQVLTAKEECKGEDGKGCGCAAASQEQQPAPAQLQRLPGKVLYGSQKGTAATFAKQLARQAATFGVELQAVDLQDYEVEQLWKEHLVLLVLSTYESGTPPDSAR